MDLHTVIRKLHLERDKLDQVIASLEQLQKAAESGDILPKKQRGRKFMNEEDRKEVSERMKKYWAAWRKKQQQGTGRTGPA